MMGWRVLLVAVCLVVGLVYEGLIWFGWGALMPRFPTPYAVPIFDVPFALVAIGIGYLCLERHRLRQDARSAGMGTTLWLTALLAFSHVLAQPDYPANPGVNAGIAPFFFFLSYFGSGHGRRLATRLAVSLRSLPTGRPSRRPHAWIHRRQRERARDRPGRSTLQPHEHLPLINAPHPGISASPRCPGVFSVSSEISAAC
jgi:hypothetical protein